MDYGVFPKDNNLPRRRYHEGRHHRTGHLTVELAPLAFPRGPPIAIDVVAVYLQVVHGSMRAIDAVGHFQRCAIEGWAGIVSNAKRELGRGEGIPVHELVKFLVLPLSRLLSAMQRSP
jgi:hypothetical protein